MGGTVEVTMFLAVDPGKATGWVLMEDGAVRAFGEHGQQEFCDLAWDLLETGTVRTVVCERWVTMRGRAYTNEPAPAEIIGALRWMCGRTGSLLVLQSAASAKAFATSGKLAAHPEVRGGGGHAKDALRHAVLWLAAGRQG